jgi:hypothetical protein
MAAWVAETVFGDKIFADTVRLTRAKTVMEYTDFVAQRNDFTRSFDEQVRQLLGAQKYRSHEPLRSGLNMASTELLHLFKPCHSCLMGSITIS